MKAYWFSSIMNIVAAIALFGAGSKEMNNLGAAVPAVLCVAAAVLAVLAVRQIRRDRP